VTSPTWHFSQLIKKLPFSNLDISVSFYHIRFIFGDQLGGSPPSSSTSPKFRKKYSHKIIFFRSAITTRTRGNRGVDLYIMFIVQPSNYVPNFININTAKLLSTSGLGDPKNAKKRVFPYDFRPRYLGPY